MEDGEIISRVPSTGTNTLRSWPICFLQGPGTKPRWETEAQKISHVWGHMARMEALYLPPLHSFPSSHL